jgi:hypothetical protein
MSRSCPSPKEFDLMRKDEDSGSRGGPLIRTCLSKGLRQLFHGWHLSYVRTRKQESLRNECGLYQSDLDCLISVRDSREPSAGRKY